MTWESPYTLLLIGVLAIAFFFWRSEYDSSITKIRQWALLVMGIMALISGFFRILNG